MNSYILALKACACMALLALCTSTCQRTLAQVESADTVSNKTDARAYRTLFRRVNGIRVLYEQGKSANKDLSYLKKDLAWRLGISMLDYETLEVVAGDCETDLAPIHAQVKNLVNDFHKRYAE